MKLFDAHCHLPESGIDLMMDCAAAAGVERMAVCGTSSKDWNEIFQCLEKYPQIFPSIGIHPWFVGCRAGVVTPLESAITDRGYNWKCFFQTLEEMVRKVPNLGIGETGLDFQSRFTNRAEQEASFVAHLDLARELNRPVAVHCVQAWGRLIEILKEHSAPRVLLHAFGGSPELIDLNCWFSFGEAVMNPNAKKARASAVAVPSDRILIETDSVDEPERLICVARAVAELRGVSTEDLARLTFANAEAFFDQ